MTCLKLIGDLVHNWTYDCKPLFCIVALWSQVGKKFNHLQKISDWSSQALSKRDKDSGIVAKQTRSFTE